MAKATVVRKSLGPKRPCGFDSRPGHEKDLVSCLFSSTLQGLVILCPPIRPLFAKDEGVNIDGEAAVDGVARVGEVDAEPLEGLEGDASAIIEGVDTAARSDGVCMIPGA